MALIIGLTGGIGSGKTVVSDYLSTLGVPIIDTDVIARDIVKPGSPALNQLSERFGASILNPDGSLKRDQLRAIAFSSPENKSALDQITHPAIRELANQRLDEVNYPYCLLVVPLLVGSKFINSMDRVLLVTADQETKIARVEQRSELGRSEILKIMASQSSDKQRMEIADDVIKNDGSIEDAQEAAKRLHESYLELAAAKQS